MILSKVWHPDDLLQLPEEAAIVDRHWDDSQHWSRRWEYAMALRAFDVWVERDPRSIRQLFAYDIGGAGSPFRRMLPVTSVVIDPNEPGDPNGRPQTLERLLTRHPAKLGPAVFCISVIEHVDDLDQFLYYLSCLVAPGGLLFLTTDYQPDDGPDNKHFHWMRKRIFGPVNRIDLTEALCSYQFSWLGERDFAWHGPIETWGYAPCSLALVKRQ